MKRNYVYVIPRRLELVPDYDFETLLLASDKRYNRSIHPYHAEWNPVIGRIYLN